MTHNDFRTDGTEMTGESFDRGQGFARGQNIFFQVE